MDEAVLLSVLQPDGGLLDDFARIRHRQCAEAVNDRRQVESV